MPRYKVTMFHMITVLVNADDEDSAMDIANDCMVVRIDNTPVSRKAKMVLDHWGGYPGAETEVEEVTN